MAVRDDTVESPQTAPQSDVYTGMLIISLIALLVGCVLLFLDYKRYPTEVPKPVERSDVQVSPPTAEQGKDKTPAEKQPPKDK